VNNQQQILHVFAYFYATICSYCQSDNHHHQLFNYSTPSCPSDKKITYSICSLSCFDDVIEIWCYCLLLRLCIIWCQK